MAKSKQGSLKDRLARTKVREKTRTADVKVPGGGSLPAGMTGVAKLTRLDFDEITEGDHKGSQRMYAHGVCVRPKTFKDSEGNEHVTEGSLVQLSRIVLDDTTYNGKVTSFEENFAKAENRLKLLGVPTEEIDDDDFEGSVLEYVKDADLYFNFRTWKPDDNDRVSVVLVGPAKPPQQGDDDDEVVEEEVEEIEEVQPKKAAKKEPPKKAEPKKSEPPAKVKKAPTPPPVEEEEEEEEEEADQLDPSAIRKIGKLADKGDEKLQTDLAEMADTFSIDTTDYEDWSAVAEAIIQAQSGASDEEEEEEPAEEVTPDKGDIYLYKGSECEVLTVFAQSKKVNLKDLASGKTFKTIGWSDLKVVE